MMHHSFNQGKTEHSSLRSLESLTGNNEHPYFLTSDRFSNRVAVLCVLATDNKSNIPFLSNSSETEETW